MLVLLLSPGRHRYPDRDPHRRAHEDDVCPPGARGGTPAYRGTPCRMAGDDPRAAAREPAAMPPPGRWKLLRLCRPPDELSDVAFVRRGAMRVVLRPSGGPRDD